jgi:ectoine hydroxylase-related dioxygenase (phytanoyl-CoA dioxygenase family)
MINREQIRIYREKGYLVVKDVLPKEEVSELGRVTHEFLEKSREVTVHTAVFDLEPDHTPEAPKLRRIKQPHKQHPVYGAVHRNERILDIVEQLVGPDIRSIGTKLNMKAPGGGSQVEWHTDWGFYPHTNDDILEVGIPLDDMKTENGCLMVIPGSHAGPAWSHHEEGVFVGAVSEEVFDIESAVPVIMKAGDISIHHVRLLHGSAPNVSSKPRRLLLHSYMAADAFPLRGVPDWDEWNSMIVRGSLTYEARLEKVPVYVPFPLPDKASSIFAIQEAMKKSHYRKAKGG